MVKITNTQLNEYVLTSDAYYGEGQFAHGGAIIPHQRELELVDRKLMAFYENLVMPLVNSIVNPVFAEEAKREYDSEILEAFLENVDNAGTSMDMFIKDVSLTARLLGQAFVIMDNFEFIPESLSDVLENRMFPFVYMKKPQDVYEFEQDQFGNLTYISFYYGEDAEGNTLYKGWNDNSSYIYRYNSNEEGYVRIVVKEVPHQLGVIPVVCINKDILPFAPYYSMATQARAVYNLDSEMRDLSRSQGFSILVIPGQQPKDGVVIGSKNALFISIDASQTPSFIGPDTAILSGLLTYRKELVDGIMRSGDILGSTAVSNGSASGVSLAYRYMGTSDALKQTANVAEFYDKKIVELFSMFIDEDIEYDVYYDDNYTPTFTDTKEKIATLETVLAIDISPEVNAQLQKDIISMVGKFMDYDDELLAILKDGVSKRMIETESEI